MRIITVIEERCIMEEFGMDRAEKAAALHREGYNCAQAAACVFADDVGIDESVLYKICEGFGAGMGTAKGVCGAVSGAAVIAGLVNSDGNTENPGQTKMKSTRAAGTIQRKFAEEAKALICRDIKTGNNGGAYTSCPDCIRIAVRLTEEVLGL